MAEMKVVEPKATSPATQAKQLSEKAKAIGRKPVPAGESNDQKLHRLASKRIPAAVKRIMYCGNLAAYKPSDDQAAAIISALQDAVNNVRLRLRGSGEKQETFLLPN